MDRAELENKLAERNQCVAAMSLGEHHNAKKHLVMGAADDYHGIFSPGSAYAEIGSFGPGWVKPPRDEHGYFPLVLPVCFPEICNQIPFFKQRTDINPYSPEDIEQEPVKSETRARPYHEQNEKIQGVPHKAVGTVDGQRHFFRFLAAEAV